MSTEQKQRQCLLCKTCPATEVWAIPDDGQPLGHNAVITCANCKPSNVFMENVCKYRPESCDYYLGYSRTKPSDTVYESRPRNCYDCNVVIDGETGYGWKGREMIYFCMPCYGKRGNQSVDIEEEPEENYNDQVVVG